MALLQTALDDLGDRDPDLTVRLHVHKTTIDLLSAQPTQAHEVTLERLRELVGRHLPASRSAALILANLLAVRGENCQEIVGLIERGLDNDRFLAEETCEALPVILGVWALLIADELDRAHALTEAMLADARTRGSMAGFVAATGRRGTVALRRGMLAEAEADTRAALELATEHNLTWPLPFHAAHLALTLLERGQLDQAAAAVGDVTLDGTIVGIRTRTVLLEARGRVHLAGGHRAQAIADLRYCGELADRASLRNPNFLAWRSALALALAPERPQEAWTLAQTDLQLARRIGTPRAIGIALRVCGQLAPAQERIKLLEQSVAVLESSPARLELAYSLTELGAALRRAGKRAAARPPLRRALDLAHRCGATPLAQRAHEEALATGARPRRSRISGVDALTPSELRIARLTAQSLSNRDIAQALFITTKTVSDHLSSIYRKLNIHTREELNTTMTAHASSETPSVL
jgi:DNA-binding CsgD family transcriptional regulator